MKTLLTYRQAMSNIYTMLKPGGDMLLAFLANSPIFSIYENMAKMKRWSKYMQNIDECIAPFQNSKHPREEYEAIISEIGFKSRFCRVENRVFTYSNVTILQSNYDEMNLQLEKFLHVFQLCRVCFSSKSFHCTAFICRSPNVLVGFHE